MLLALFVAVETRVEHPLLPFRIFANQTEPRHRGDGAAAPPAMFAMFFFLKLFIQNIMGYSPLKTGVAFLPFSVGIVLSAGIVSNLVNRFDARYIAGVGTLISAASLFGFSRLTVPDSGTDVVQAVLSGQHVGADVNYWTQLLPFIFFMAVGMGAVGAAAHPDRRPPRARGGLRHRVGRAEHHAADRWRAGSGDPWHRREPRVDLPHRGDRADRGAGSAAGRPEPARRPDGRLQRRLRVEDLVGQVAYLGAFTEGATAAFLVGVFLMLAGSAVVWAFLDVEHRADATDGPEGGVHVGWREWLEAGGPPGV